MTDTFRVRRFATLLIVFASVAGCDGARETMDSSRTSSARSQASRSEVPASTRLATASTAPIVFVRGERALVHIKADGKGMRVLTRMPPGYKIASVSWAPRAVVWSPDGRRIAFEASSHIFVVNADGSGRRRLTSHSDVDSNPTWSPDGTKIAFDRNHDGYNRILVVNADGTGERRLTPRYSHYYWNPIWSTDGRRIVFRNHLRPKWLYVMNSDGSGRRRLVRDDDLARRPSARKLARLGFTGVWLLNADGSRRWSVVDIGGSHDGRRIAFSDVTEEGNDSAIFVVDADGARRHALTRNRDFEDVEPSWSPDGKALVFTRSVAWQKGGIYVVNADGSGEWKLTDTHQNERLPAWSPKR